MGSVWRAKRCERAGKSALVRLRGATGHPIAASSVCHPPGHGAHLTHNSTTNCWQFIPYSIYCLQIVLYVVSRVITSLLPRATPARAPSPLPPLPAGAVPYPPGAPYPSPRAPNAKVFELYAALTWGAVMWLFAERRDKLQGGMVNSMQVSARRGVGKGRWRWRGDGEGELTGRFGCAQYLYLDSERWNGLKTLLWRQFWDGPRADGRVLAVKVLTSDFASQTTARLGEGERARWAWTLVPENLLLTMYINLRCFDDALHVWSTIVRLSCDHEVVSCEGPKRRASRRCEGRAPAWEAVARQGSGQPRQDSPTRLTQPQLTRWSQSDLLTLWPKWPPGHSHPPLLLSPLRNQQRVSPACLRP